jgi:hypothetical protein
VRGPVTRGRGEEKQRSTVSGLPETSTTDPAHVEPQRTPAPESANSSKSSPWKSPIAHRPMPKCENSTPMSLNSTRPTAIVAAGASPIGARAEDITPAGT